MFLNKIVSNYNCKTYQYMKFNTIIREAPTKNSEIMTYMLCFFFIQSITYKLRLWIKINKLYLSKQDF